MPFVHKRSLSERLNAILDKSGGPDSCWLFTGKWTVGNMGYGMASYKGRKWLVHRLAYTEHYGDIPDGLRVLHSCDTPLCGNWAHLRTGTQAENMQDKVDRGRSGKRTHCTYGHPLTDDNLYVNPNTGTRACRACRVRRAPAYWRAQDEKRRIKRQQMKEQG